MRTMELEDQLRRLQGKQARLTMRGGHRLEGLLRRVEGRAVEMECGGIVDLGAIAIVEWMGGRMEVKAQQDGEVEEVMPAAELDVEWLWAEATVAEQEMGRLHHAAVLEAINGMRREPTWKKAVDEKVCGVRMIAASGGRLAIEEGWLEVGFGDASAPPPPREMKELLSLIL